MSKEADGGLICCSVSPRWVIWEIQYRRVVSPGCGLRRVSHSTWLWCWSTEKGISQEINGKNEKYEWSDQVLRFNRWYWVNWAIKLMSLMSVVVCLVCFLWSYLRISFSSCQIAGSAQRCPKSQASFATHPPSFDSLNGCQDWWLSLLERHQTPQNLVG